MSITSWRDFLGEISGYKTKYERCSANFAQCHDVVLELGKKLDQAEETIRQLELLVPRPPPPEIDYVVERDSAWVQQQIDSMDLGIIRYPLNAVYPMTNQANTLNIIAWDWADKLPWIRTKFDCEEFALLFHINTALFLGLRHVGIVLDYSSGHAYNLILYPDGNKQILEPQSDGLYIWTQRPEQFYPLNGAVVLI